MTIQAADVFVIARPGDSQNYSVRYDILQASWSISWTQLTGIPATFPPDVHVHTEGEITNLVADLASKVPNARTLTATAPVTGGGDLSVDRNFGISDFVGSGVGHARGSVPDPGAIAGITKFLREDGGWQVPVAVATVNIKSIEVDFGATPIYYAVFPVVDAEVFIASNISIWLSGESPTGRDADEAEMEPMECSAFDIVDGGFNAVIQVHDGPVDGKYKLNYLIG